MTIPSSFPKLRGVTPQTSFSPAEFADKKKITRREKFLARLEEIIPRAALLAVLEPFSPKEERGRPPSDWSACCGCISSSNGMSGGNSWVLSSQLLKEGTDGRICCNRSRYWRRGSRVADQREPADSRTASKVQESCFGMVTRRCLGVCVFARDCQVL